MFTRLTKCPDCKGGSRSLPQGEYPDCTICYGDHKPRWRKRTRARLRQPLLDFCGCGWPDRVLGWWLPGWLHGGCGETIEF